MSDPNVPEAPVNKPYQGEAGRFSMPWREWFGLVGKRLGSVQSALPSGMIAPFALTTAPAGWLYCDGSAVSRSSYASLYAAVGDAFGAGDGSTTFNLPDFRGRFLRGQDDGAGTDPDAGSRTAMASGGNTGDNVGSVQADELKSHTHTTAKALDGSVLGPGPSSYMVPSPTGTTNSDWVSTASGGNETRPVNAGVRYYIKT